MGFHNIEKKSFGYRTLFIVVRFWHDVVFNRKITIINKENIPEGANVMFTPNHQAALMDATAILFSVPRQLIFMARADIFKKKRIAAILYFLKILPIYRQRDGKGSMKKNDDVFKRTADVLTAGLGLVMFPEGSHEGVYEVLPLKKGFARIAFQTEEANNFSLDMRIVPVGIDYRNRENFKTTLLINFGTPISISQYYKKYQENPAVAILSLKTELEGKMRALIVNIESKSYHALYILLKDIYNEKMRMHLGLEKRNHLNCFKADREFVRLFSLFEKNKPDEMDTFNNLFTSFANKRKQFKVSNEMLAAGKPSFFSLALKAILLLATFPLFAYGFVNNLLPWGITAWRESKIQVPQFKSSFTFIISMLVFPIAYVLQTIVFAQFSEVSWLTWAYLLSLPVSAVFAFWWNEGFSRLKKQWGFFRFSHKANPDFEQMMTEYKLIIGRFPEIVPPKK